MPVKLSARLANEKSTIILDGALATQLEVAGHDLNNPLWSASLLLSLVGRDEQQRKKNPDAITKVHLDYYLAGADVATTASYQATVLGLQKHGKVSETEARDCILESVKCAQTARILAHEQQSDRKGALLIAGSVGPYGAYLANGAEYAGNYGMISDEELFVFHSSRIDELVESGVDVLAFETIPSFQEVNVLAGILLDNPSVEAWMAFTLKDETSIADGTSLKAVLRSLEGYRQIVAVGVNCMAPDIMDKALSYMATLTKKPLVAYPNSGEGYDPSNKQWKEATSKQVSLTDLARKWSRNGVRLIGGCCRTTPRDIAAMKQAANAS